MVGLAESRSESLLRQTRQGNFVCPKNDIRRTQCRGPRDCLYANPDNCDSFIQCTVNGDRQTGTPVVAKCPSGLQWSDRTKICVPSYLSTCPNQQRRRFYEDEQQQEDMFERSLLRFFARNNNNNNNNNDMDGDYK